jgi:Do/DeqQ family serine protease
MTVLRRARRKAAALLAIAVVGSAPLTLSAALPLTDGPLPVATLAPLLEQVTPAVVNISVLTAAPAQENPLMRDPFFRRFFNLPDTLPQQAPPRMSAGSGVIVDAGRGYVLTNHHVIQNATEVTVTLKDRRRFKAQIAGSDPETDIAVLKIEADRLTDLRIGDSDTLRVGDFVVAIGNPFGLGQTVTSGIVSALGRTGLNIEGYEDFIQTDASINPGNSGGALINLAGALVGVNTAIFAPAGGNVGIGFAVPSNMARAVMDQLVRHGEVRRGRLGIGIQDVTPEIAETLGLERGVGALVTNVEPGSAAERAGIRAGDLIVAVDGRAIETASELRNRVGLVPVDQRVGIEVIREGRRITVESRLGASERAAVAARGKTPARLQGADLRELVPGMPAYGRVEGVLVEAVERGSRAWNAGLRDGDIIMAVNRRRVSSVAETNAALERPSRALTLNVLRGDTVLMILIQ